MHLDFPSLAKKLLIAGLAGVALCLLLWTSSRPPAPNGYQLQQAQGSLIGGFGVRAQQDAHDNYYQCFTARSTAYAGCPLGGNFYLLFWASVLLAAAGGLMLTSLTTTQRLVPPADRAPSIPEAAHSHYARQTTQSPAMPPISKKNATASLIALSQVISAAIGGAFGATITLSLLGMNTIGLVIGHFFPTLLFTLAAWGSAVGVAYAAFYVVRETNRPTRYNTIGSLLFGLVTLAIFATGVFGIDFKLAIPLSIVAGYWVGGRMQPITGSGP